MRAVIVLLGIAALLRAEDDRRAIPVKDPVLRKKINEAIDRGVAYLKSQQRAGGYWTGPEDEAELKRATDCSILAGHTALALYALAASGVPEDDPALRRGVRWIEDHPEAFDGGLTTGTYTNSVLVLALTRINPRAHRALIHKAADRLATGQLGDGMWTYVTGTMRRTTPARAEDRAAWRRGSGVAGIPDNSNTQFAVLALWAAHSMAGYEAPRKVWEKARKHFRKQQLPDGGWSYRKIHRKSSTTMTAAGVVSLVYAEAALDPDPKALERARKDSQVQHGLHWLRLDAVPGRKSALRATRGGVDYYWVYSLERVGTVLALDPERWYLPGARYLVEQQAKGGSWGRPAGVPGGDAATDWTYETSLALLFLTRPTCPPIRGVTTERREEKPVVITPKDGFPDVTTQKGLADAFEHYRIYNTDDRARVLAEFGKAGPAAVRLFIDRLADKRAPVRAAAYELLTKLVEKPLLFDPAAPAEARAIMLAPIEAFWERDGARLKWDPKRARFVIA